MSFALQGQTKLEIASIEYYSFQHGLSDQVILHYALDNRGLAWLTSNSDVNRFDGYKFLAFRKDTSTLFGLHGGTPKKTLAAVGGYMVVVYQSQKRFVDAIHHTDLMPQKVILDSTNHAIRGKTIDIFEKDGAVYFITQADETLRIYRLTEKLKPTLVCTTNLHLTVDEHNSLSIIGNGDKYYLHTPSEGLFLLLADGTVRSLSVEGLGNVKREVNYLKADCKGQVWLSVSGVGGGVFLNPHSSNVFRAFDLLPSGQKYTDQWNDTLGNTIFATRNDPYEIKKLYGFKCVQYKGGFSYSSFDPNAVLRADQKIAYLFSQNFFDGYQLATYTGYFKVKIRNTLVKSFLNTQLKHGEYGVVIRGICTDSNGLAYISREVNTWYKYDQNNGLFDTLKLIDEDSGQRILINCGGSLFRDVEGYIYGKSCSGSSSSMLLRYDPQTGKSRVYQVDWFINTFTMDRSGHIWVVGSETSDSNIKTLYHFVTASGKFEPFTDANQTNPLTSHFKEPASVQYLLPARDGHGLYVATNQGVIYIQTSERWSKPIGQDANGNNLFSAQSIFTLYENTENELFIGTGGGGLNVLDLKTGKLEVFNRRSGLSNELVSAVVEDKHHNYWISTFSGLNYFTRKSGTFDRFFERDGLTHNDFSMLSGHFDSLTGNFFFGGVNGINIFKEQDLRRNEHFLKVLISRIVTSNATGSQTLEQHASLDSLESIVLMPGMSHLQLDFVLNDIFNASEAQFFYRIDSQNSHWQALGTDHTLRLNNLSPGNHKLFLKGTNSKGSWSDPNYYISLVVQQYFYQTLWFRLASISAIFGALFWLWAFRTKEARKRELEKAAFEKQLVNLELKTLQAQMNPHFIFNALGAIQYHIKNNDAHEADLYLAKFAQLMRLFLESSKNKFVTLKEELHILRVYLELEQFRFNHRWDFEVNVDEEIDEDNTEVPTMLIQPFLENAINHGLFNKASGGLLTISIYRKADFLHIVVADNGIGREEAKRIRESTIGGHKSRAMQIIEERLDALRKVNDLDVRIEFTDMTDVQGNATGTSVLILIPEDIN